MSKKVNILLALLIIPSAVLALLIGFDLNALGFIQGEETPFAEAFFIGVSFISGGLLFWLAFRRWSSLFVFKNKKQFLWLGSSTPTHINRVRFYLILEMLFLILVGFYFYRISPFTFYLGLIFFAATFEKLLFIILRCNTKHLKAGIIKNGLVIADRDLSFFYFSGLTSVSTQNDSIYLEYRNDLCLSFPIHAINKEDRASFIEHFITAVDKKKVFVSDKIKAL